MNYDLKRFIIAQEENYTTALKEIRAGCKKSHWMWFILPQLKGLGKSNFARIYGISSLDEAKDYLQHPILGSRLKEITTALLNLTENNITAILKKPDDMKLKSCMPLFLLADNLPDNIFNKVLHKYFHGEKDSKTLLLLSNPNHSD